MIWGYVMGALFLCVYGGLFGMAIGMWFESKEDSKYQRVAERIQNISFLMFATSGLIVVVLVVSCLFCSRG